MGEMRESLGVDLWAYVIMPEHVHLLVHPRRSNYRMAHILGALKRPVSARAKKQLIESNNGTWLARLTVQEGKKSVFRFWQAGGGYDENLWNERPIHEVIASIMPTRSAAAWW
jgi:putative transposase